MKRLWWAWCIGVVLALSGCGDDCDLTTAPVVEQPCDDDRDDCDDRDDDEGRDTLRVGFPWPSRPPK
jgi:hypothetical protein